MGVLGSSGVVSDILSSWWTRVDSRTCKLLFDRSLNVSVASQMEDFDSTYHMVMESW